MARPDRIKALCAMALALPAWHAGATTLDFESLTRGTVITTQLQSQGVLVSGFDSSHCCAPGKVINVALADLGVSNFGGSGNQALVYGIPGDQLRFDFVLPNTSTPTSWDTVSLRVGDGDPFLETFRVTFRDLTGAVLSAQTFTTNTGPVNGGVSVGFSGAAIRSVEVLGIGNFSGGGVDDLQFGNTAAVPEPAGWALLAGGLALLSLQARRRRG